MHKKYDLKRFYTYLYFCDNKTIENYKLLFKDNVRFDIVFYC